MEYPRPYIKDPHYNFSFSGLKTAVINHLHSMDQRGQEYRVENIAASFQQAVVDVLVDKTIKAAEDTKSKRIVLAGGVAANSALKTQLGNRCREKGMELYYPTPLLCTDNGAMIASAGYYRLRRYYIRFNSKRYPWFALASYITSLFSVSYSLSC